MIISLGKIAINIFDQKKFGLDMQEILIFNNRYCSNSKSVLKNYIYEWI